MGSAHGYRYVGPADLAERASPGPDVITVTSAQALTRWLASRPADELGEPFTFVVGLGGQLRLGPRRSEHVDCAAGQPVLGAGEVLFTREGPGRWSARSATSPPVTARIRIHGQRLPRRWTGSAWRTPATSRTSSSSAAAPPAASSTSSGTAASPARYATAPCRSTGISALPESAGPGTTAMRICGLIGAHCASRTMEIELRLQERSPGPAHQPDAASESSRGWSSRPISLRYSALMGI